MRFRSAMAALAGLIVASTSAAAQEVLSAQAPSHNIACMAMPPGPGQPSVELRCDIMKKTSRPPPRPANCRLSWGDAFVLDPTGSARLFCHGDTVFDPSAPVIAYGTQWRPYGFACTSQIAGLTCVNAAGHGFSISRAAQKIF